MKITFLLLGSVLLAIPSSDSAVVVPYGRISPFSDLSTYDKADLAYLRDYARPKRSGSGDALQHLKTQLGQGIKAKLGYFAKGSASASSHFSGGGYHGSPYHGHDEYDHDAGKFDLWSFKKSVLYTLLSAVKAIKGGVIAIKGQLIKGGGHLLATKGKIIKGGGEALSSLGKSIASSAFLYVPDGGGHGHEEHDSEHYEYVPPSTYGHSGPGPEYHQSAPSGPGPEYGPPGHYKHGSNSVYEGKDGPHHDGIVILKKIPTGHDSHEGQETQNSPPDFKPISHSALPTVHNLMGAMFSASSNPFEHVPRKQQHTAHSIQVQSQSKPSVPSTNYGNPIGNPVKYLEYFNTQANTIQLNQQQKGPNYVTPTPAATYNVELPNAEAINHQYNLDLPKGTQSSYNDVYKAPDNQHQYNLDLIKAQIINSQNNYEAYQQQPNHQQQTYEQQSYAQQPQQTYEQPQQTYEQPNHQQTFNQQQADFENGHLTYKLELPRTPVSNQHDDFPTNQPHVFIGMNLPLDNLENELNNLQKTKPHLPRPKPTQHSPQFLIHYPDPTELAKLHDSMPQASKLRKERHPKPPSSSSSHTKQHKKSPPQNFEIVRSIAFELGPKGPVKL